MSTEIILFNFEPILLFIFLDEDVILKISVCLIVVKFINSFSSIFLNISTIFGTISDDAFEKNLDIYGNENLYNTDDYTDEHLSLENMPDKDLKKEADADNKKR